MDERLQFVARWLIGEPMADLCREFGISRKTGYKIFACCGATKRPAPLTESRQFVLPNSRPLAQSSPSLRSIARGWISCTNQQGQNGCCLFSRERRTDTP